MLPLLSSMHFVNCCVAPWQLLPQLLLFWADSAWVAWVGSGALEPPPQRLEMPLPTMWPTEEPMATPAAVLAIWAIRPGLCEGAPAAEALGADAPERAGAGEEAPAGA